MSTKAVTRISLVIMTGNNTRKHFFKRSTVFFIFTARLRFILGRMQSVAQPGVRGHQPPLAKSFRKYNQKKRKRLNVFWT